MYVVDYANIRAHKAMLRDLARGEAFGQALAEVVEPGMTVLDVGAGTGVLSLFAARAGARRVYAVERTGVARLARRIVADNGFADRIEVLEGEMDEVELPGEVDLIVSELLGGVGVDENMLPMVLRARDRWLGPRGRMMPRRIRSWLAPAWDSALHDEMAAWRRELYGLDFSAVVAATARDIQGVRNHVKPADLLAAPQVTWDVDMLELPAAAAAEPFSATLDFRLERDGRFNGMAGWFEAPLADGVTLTNSPAAADTHWGRYVFPLDRTLDARRGMEVAASLWLQHAARGVSRARWTVRTGDYRFATEDVFYWKV